MKIISSAIMMALVLTGAIQAQVFAPPQKVAPADKAMIEKYVANTQVVVSNWLAMTDQGRYAESWDASSSMFKTTISKKEWVEVMTTLRKPLGNVISRKIIDIGNAENPKGLPNGEYMVYYYKTEFTSKGKTSELITLELSNDGQWRVLTYQIL